MRTVHCQARLETRRAGAARQVACNQRGRNASQLNIGGMRLGSFNDRFRDALMGGSPFASPRYQGFATGLATAPNAFTQARWQRRAPPSPACPRVSGSQRAPVAGHMGAVQNAPRRAGAPARWQGGRGAAQRADRAQGLPLSPATRQPALAQPGRRARSDPAQAAGAGCLRGCSGRLTPAIALCPTRTLT
jgi:hypothetical protein